MVYIMKHKTVHVGIVAYENTKDLDRCLQSIRKQTYPYITVTIFDNSTRNAVNAFIRSKHSWVRYFKSAYNCGYGVGHNAIIRGLNAVSNDYYLTVNHDAILDTYYIENLVGCLQKEHAGWGMGKILDSIKKEKTKKIIYSAGHAITRNGYFFNIGYGLPDNGLFDKKQEIFGASGAVAMYSFRLIEKVAYNGEFFDSTFFMYSEDTDIDWRARNAGFSCMYCPQAIAYHRGGQRPSWVTPYAIAHRYLSAIKNASLNQLIFSIVPFMIPHLLFRLFITPKQGLFMMFIFLTKAPYTLYKRKLSMIISQNKWFTWSTIQPTTQPVHFVSRFSVFVGNLFN